jgi:hypothetical protein
MMANAARAYDYNLAQSASAYPQRQPRPQRVPDIRVIPTRRNSPVPEPLPSSTLFLAKTVAVILIMVALLGFVRIGLASAAVETAVSSEELSTQIKTELSDTNALQVKASSLANPTYIRTEASELGMAAPTASSTITLSEDIVKSDNEGNLSLAQSLVALGAQVTP